MRELFKSAAKITNLNLILTIPLIIGIMIFDLYSAYSKYTVDTSLKSLIAAFTILFMLGVFCSGWFYMVKEAVKLSKKVFVLDSDRARETMNLFKKFPEGVGKFFLAFVGLYVIFFFIQIIITPFVYIIGTKLIGGLDSAAMQSLQSMAMDPAITTNAGMTEFIEKLTPEQIVFMGKWSLLFMVITSIVMYLLMLWIPEIIYKTPNPLVALWRSLVKLFKDFWTTLRLFLSLWFMGFGLLFINTFAMFNPVIYLIMSVVMFYFSVYMIVVIFLYYDNKYMSNDEK